MPHAPRPDLAELLTSIGGRDGRLVHLEHTPARPGRQADWPTWADPRLIEAYARQGIERPWTHQAHAAQALHTGQHTVLATGTGSGKSLAAWLPIVSEILTAQDPGPSTLTATPTPGRATARAADPRQPSSGPRARPTGSGLGARRPTALYLAPTKALAADQEAALSRLVGALEAIQREAGAPAGSLRTVRTGTCDGDTPLPERDWVRAHADIVLTNPDFLHFSLLPGHERWSGLLRGLRYVVVDECHAYRGVLGAHVALVLRRLMRLARRLQRGPGPTVLCASATAAEPALTAARLIGVEPEAVTAVTEDGAPAGERTLALWQPALRDPWLVSGPASPEPAATDSSRGVAAQPAGAPAASEAGAARRPGPAHPLSPEGPTIPNSLTADPDHSANPEPGPEDGPSADPSARRSAVIEASELLVDILGAGARSLVFVRSRRSAEAVAEHARRVLGRSFPELVGTVAAYRGGYLPEERRALEASLRAGRLRGLATTSALELGIDVSGLDAVLIAGWPGTRASLNQQAGRAGRAGGRGLAVLIASDNPLDAYLIHHPHAVLAAPEATVFDPANPYVLAPHLCAAASESPLRQEDLALFGLPDDSLLAELEQRGALRRRPAGWFWNAHLPGRPQDLTSLRGEGPGPVAVVEADTGAVVGTVDGAAAESTVHPGAVYIHQGRVFVVEELTQEAALVRARAAVDYRTRARSHSSVRILAERERQEWGSGVGWSFGSVEVTSQVTGYTRMALPGMEVISSHALDMPEHVLPTAAVWWTAPLEACREAGLEPQALPGALHAAEHASIGLLPLLATCDRWDIGGLSTQVHAQTGEPTVFIHDGHAGGAGFAERGFRAGRQWLTATLAAIEDCGCASGCPSCVQSPKCGNNNEPLDKAGAVALLRLLLAAAPTEPGLQEPEPGQDGESAQ